MNNNFKNKMIELSRNINVSISEEQIEKFYVYMKTLLEWNEKINLTAITEENDIILKHFIDSMTILKYIEKEKSVIDVGTGAGFPGIPISIMKNDVKVTLLDSLNKRINFLNEVSKQIKLNNIKTIHGRAEDIGHDKKYRETFDIAVSRAVANMTTLSEYLLPMVNVGGVCICMKGSEIEQELNDSKFAIKEFGGEILEVDKFLLPNSDIERNIVLIKKIKETSQQYPRKAGMPSKTPMFHR